MAIPLWRQYTRLTPEQRREILDRRRRRLDETSNRGEVLDALLQDAREVREKYSNRNGAPAGEAAAPADSGSEFVSPDVAAAADRLGIAPGQVSASRNRMAALLEQDYNRRQQTIPASQRTPFRRPSDEVLDNQLAQRLGRE